MGRTWMSAEEVRRAGILERIERGELKQIEASELLGVSYRQTKRLVKRYRAIGAEGLVHGNTGRRSRHAKPEALREKAMQLVREHYSGGPGERFGPTLAAEHLSEEYGIELDHETLRRWMLEAGLWSRERRSRKHRRRRARKGHFGELLQMDGSFHEWLEKRGGRGCLINLVDDATGTTLAWFSEEETTWAVADVLRAWVQKYGIPRAIYTDWKSVYHAPPEGEEQEQRLSQFGQMCGKLGIALIAANSPQAKGRVERNHGTHQDRLIKKMRRLGIGSYSAAIRKPIAICSRAICRSTTRGLRSARRSLPIFTMRCGATWIRTRSSVWSASGWSAATGWSVITTVCCSWRPNRFSPDPPFWSRNAGTGTYGWCGKAPRWSGAKSKHCRSGQRNATGDGGLRSPFRPPAIPGSESERLRRKQRCGNDGLVDSHGKPAGPAGAGITVAAGFPPLPTALGKRRSGVSHISTAPTVFIRTKGTLLSS